MKSLMFGLGLVLATAASLSPASADGPRASSSNTIPQTAGAAPAYNTVGTPHYVWQYGYVGRHPRVEGRWVLVQ